jgi:isoleucyl-tRNA synthetase
VLRDFKVPEGFEPEDLRAAGDGEVLAVLDLRRDDSLVSAGLARELVNRVQKLRKSAGLVVTDEVEVFYRAEGAWLGPPQPAYCHCPLQLRWVSHPYDLS